MAHRLRKRGLQLPIDKAYVTPRVAAIAAEQAELFKKLDALDDEIRRLAVSFGE
jgi:hypothetical protein